MSHSDKTILLLLFCSLKLGLKLGRSGRCLAFFSVKTADSNHAFTVTHTPYECSEAITDLRHGAHSATQQLLEPTVFPYNRNGK